MITEENIEVRYPLVSDSMLLQLANDIAVAEDVSRRQRTVIGRLVDGITGHGQRATALSVGALAGGERTLMAWVTEVCQSGRVTNLTLARVTRHVVGTRRALDELIEDQRGTTERVSQLTRDFEAALIRVDDKFAQVDSRLDRLEQGQQLADLRHLADHSFTESVEAWGFRQTYHDLPWACQVVLLAKEVVNGPVSLLEMVDGEPSYRERLVRHILQHDAIPSPRTPLVIATLFDDVAAELRSSGYDEFVAELLESGLTGGLMMPVGPLTALVRTTLELWVDHGGPSERLGQQALSIVRERYGWVDGTADVESFVRRVVTEQADAARALRSAWSGDDDE